MDAVDLSFCIDSWWRRVFRFQVRLDLLVITAINDVNILLFVNSGILVDDLFDVRVCARVKILFFARS